jgi:hypothetical protein
LIQPHGLFIIPVNSALFVSLYINAWTALNLASLPFLFLSRVLHHAQAQEDYEKSMLLRQLEYYQSGQHGGGASQSHSSSSMHSDAHADLR